jgi:simple sugar transport system substrate-binding protein
MTTTRRDKGVIRAHSWRLTASLAMFLAAVAVPIAVSSAPATAAGKSAAHASSSIKIAYIAWPPALGAYFTAEQLGANSAGKAMGVSVSYDSPTAAEIGNSAATATQAAVQEMQAIIAQKPSAIVANVFFPSAELPVLKAAVAAGIPVFMANDCESYWKSIGAEGCYGEEESAAGVAAGNAMAKAGVKNAICLNDTVGNPALAALCNGFDAAMKANGDSATSDLINDNGASDPTGYTQDVVGILESHPTVQGIMTTDAQDAPLALVAMKDANKTSITVGTANVSNVVIHDVASGKILFAINSQPYAQGFLPVVDATLYLKYGISTYGNVATGPDLVNKSNIQQILKTLASGVQGA